MSDVVKQFHDKSMLVGNFSTENFYLSINIIHNHFPEIINISVNYFNHVKYIFMKF